MINEIMNQATAMAYIKLRKYAYHYNIIIMQYTVGGDLVNIIRNHVRECNARIGDPKMKPFLGEIDFAKIAKYYFANLPMNNPDQLSRKGIHAYRYRLDTSTEKAQHSSMVAV